MNDRKEDEPPRAAPRVEILTESDCAAIGELLARRRRMQALATMGMLHRRKLPDGWRVIEGQRREGASV